MFIIKYKKIFVGISVILVILSLLALFSFGLNIGIDFKGGALTEVAYKFTRPNQESLNKSLESLNFGFITLQPTGDLTRRTFKNAFTKRHEEYCYRSKF